MVFALRDWHGKFQFILLQGPVSFKIITGRVLCQAIHHRAVSKALVVNCAHTVGSGGWAAAECPRGCRLSAGIWQKKTGCKILFLEGKDGHQTIMEGRMSRSGVKQSRDFLFFCALFEGHTLQAISFLFDWTKKPLRYPKYLLIKYFTIQREALFQA